MFSFQKALYRSSLLFSSIPFLFHNFLISVLSNIISCPLNRPIVIKYLFLLYIVSFFPLTLFLYLNTLFSLKKICFRFSSFQCQTSWIHIGYVYSYDYPALGILQNFLTLRILVKYHFSLEKLEMPVTHFPSVLYYQGGDT